jgi:serine/threonine protein kinase
MIRSFAKRISLLALCFLASYPAASQTLSAGTSSTPSVAQIYDGNKRIGELVSLGRSLGSGGIANVYEATIRYPNGKIKAVALRLFNSDQTPQEIKDIISHWTLLNPVYDQDRTEVLQLSKPGLKIVKSKPGMRPVSIDAIMSPIANGSIQSKRSKFRPDPMSPNFDHQLNLLVKYKRSIYEGISLLTLNGLSHGDIKPENILFTTKSGFDWDHPDSSKIRFSLTDFDSVSRIGQQAITFTMEFAPPELLAEKRAEASPAWDLYSQAATLYKLTFGNGPFQEYYEKLHGTPYVIDRATDRNQVYTEMKQVYADPSAYEAMLKNAEARFSQLDEQAPSESARKKIRELRNFVMNGLKRNPDERLKAFPDIRANLVAHLTTAHECKTLIPTLKARLAQ